MVSFLSGIKIRCARQKKKKKKLQIMYSSQYLMCTSSKDFIGHTRTSILSLLTILESIYFMIDFPYLPVCEALLQLTLMTLFPGTSEQPHQTTALTGHKFYHIHIFLCQRSTHKTENKNQHFHSYFLTNSPRQAIVFFIFYSILNSC